MTQTKSLAKRCPILTNHNTNKDGHCKRFELCLTQDRANKLECPDIRAKEVK